MSKFKSLSSLKVFLVSLIFSFSNELANLVSERGDVPEVIKFIEYILGFLYILALVVAVIEDCTSDDSHNVLWIVAGVVLCSFIMPLFVKFILWFIIAGALMFAFGGIITSALGKGATAISSAILYITGNLGSVILVLFIIAAIVSATFMTGW